MAWSNSISDEVSSGYNWGIGGLAEQGKGLFSDALNTWVQLEGIKAQQSATALAQEQTRSANQSASGTPTDYPDTGRPVSGGATLSQQQWLIGGALIAVALFMATR